jgi:mRNA interferase HigB
MLIVFVDELYAYAKKHPDAKKALISWIEAVESANWKKKLDVLADFPKAKMIKNNRARFEIVHNKYRLIILINYEAGRVSVRFIGTHNEYDRIDPETI